MIQRAKGTQDFLDLELYNFLQETTRTHLANYAFTQIATPIIEPVELFKRSLGLHTDVASKEMYYATTGQETGEPTLCLRPEATASTMRAYFNNKVQQQPWKVFSSGPMFRHERPQKGRYRQFHQTTIELLGAESVAYDAELIAMLERLFSDTLELDYALMINYLGSPQDRENYKTVLAQFLDNLPHVPAKIAELQNKNILRIFDLKDPECQKVLAQAPHITDHLSEESQAEWQQLQTYLDLLNVSYTCNPRLVRGLDYYNNTVFEFVSNDLGAQNAFCGGGRYDYLSQTLGEKHALPALGAAFGIDRILLMLEQQQKGQIPAQKPVHVVVPCSAKQTALALLLADELRAHNLCCDVLLDEASIKSKMRKANKLGACYVLLLGDEEQQNNFVTVKNMTQGTEEQVSQSKIAHHLSC